MNVNEIFFGEVFSEKNLYYFPSDVSSTERRGRGEAIGRWEDLLTPYCREMCRKIDTVFFRQAAQQSTTPKKSCQRRR